MSHSEDSQPEVQVGTPLDRHVDAHVDPHVEPAGEEPSGLTHREFLKKLVGSAAGLTGLAAAGTLLTPKTAEAVYTTGGAPYANFPAPVTTGDLISTNVHAAGNVQIKGYRPWLDVTAFGAPGNYSGYADAAVLAAITAAPATGAVLYFPAGQHLFSGPVTIAGKSITVVGAGRGATELTFQNNGFVLSNSTFGIRDLTIKSGSVNTSTAISITGGWPGGVPTTQPHIENISIIPYGYGFSWNKAIHLISTAGAKIERFEIDCGRNAEAGAGHGIHLSGGSAIANIASGVIANANIGIEVSDQYSEGLYCRGLEVLFCDTGFLLTAPGPGSAISDCHTKTQYYGIKTHNHGEMALIGNLLYGSESNYVGIELDGNGSPNAAYGSHKCRVIGNLINSGTTGMGIHLTGYTKDCIVANNVIDAPFAIGVNLNGANVTNNVVIGNRLKVATPIGPGVPGPGNVTTPNY